MEIYKMCAVALLLLAGCINVKQSKTSAFIDEEISNILSGSQETPMRVFKIDNYQDSLLLRKPSELVVADANDEVLVHFIDRLYNTVRDSLSMGVGIAAPQVGILRQVIWVQRFDKKDFPFEYYLNPTIESYSQEKQDCREGCLSIPNVIDTTRMRSKKIIINYDNLEQRDITDTVEGFTAVIFQHEIDHLDGILFVDHLNRETRETD